jgi:mRNA interferase HigB
MLREFWQKHPEAGKLLCEWHSVVEHAEFRDFNHIREFFNSVDYVPPYTIF